jgi:hypothetical protein
MQAVYPRWKLNVRLGLGRLSLISSGAQPAKRTIAWLCGCCADEVTQGCFTVSACEHHNKTFS